MASNRQNGARSGWVRRTYGPPLPEPPPPITTKPPEPRYAR